MNHAELDRLLCERLGLAPEKYGLITVVNSDGEVLGNPIAEDIGPLALALAAARALAIEVPE
jgi:hypothetical protein